MLHISIAAEKIASLWGFPITNSLLTTWIVMGIIFYLSWAATRSVNKVPGNTQLIAEMIIGGFYSFFGAITGKHTKTFFPLLMSIFIFVIVANWVGLLPGVGTVGFFHTPEITSENPEVVHGEPVVHEEETKDHQPAFTPLLRGATADVNTTLAIAIVAVIAIQYFGFRTIGAAYTTRFIDISNPINFFIGILEIISETSKIISFAFRLFGNIFAGEVLLAVMAFLMPYIVPLPFLALELFVGFIQALVFSMLTAVFLSVAVAHGEHAEHVKHA